MVERIRIVRFERRHVATSTKPISEYITRISAVKKQALKLPIMKRSNRRQQKRSAVGKIEPLALAGGVGKRIEVEMLDRVEQDDAHHSHSAQNVGHIDSRMTFDR